jgi:hypothetical protein
VIIMKDDLERSAAGGDPPDLGWLFAGFVLGFLAGAVVFTKVGRDLAVHLIRKGAGVTEAKIREWMEKGEKE